MILSKHSTAVLLHSVLIVMVRDLDLVCSLIPHWCLVRTPYNLSPCTPRTPHPPTKEQTLEPSARISHLCTFISLIQSQTQNLSHFVNAYLHSPVSSSCLCFLCRNVVKQGRREDWGGPGQIQKVGPHKMDYGRGVWGHAPRRFYML